MAPEVARLSAELAQATRDNKRLARQIDSLERLVERYRENVSAKDRLSAIISAEKSKQEKYMNLLLDNSPDIIMLFDQNGRFVYCTAAFLKCVGILNSGLIDGRTYQEVFARFADEAFIARVHATISRAMADKRTEELSETVDFARDGNPRNYEIHITPMLDEQGTAEGALVLFHDLTDILRAKEQAVRASSAKSDFLATVSHEIRTPMNAIIGISDMMMRTNLTRQQVDYMASIQNSSHVLLNLINDILDFSKIEAGKLDLLPEYFNLSAMLQQLREMFRVGFREKKIAFVCEFAPNLPSVVLGDEKRVRQVLTNIMNNAQKYTHEGKVTFRASPEGDGTIRFDVADTGIGIREPDIPRLFNAFEQLDKVRNKQVVGTGLGLAITRKLCEMMHGSIEVESTYGMGSTFTVRLPFETGAESDLVPDIQSGISFIAPQAAILVVDDIEINLMVASAMLESYGVMADQAISGADALRMIAKREYDLIYMDHMMPDMDGIETTRVIRASGGKNAAVPIIALTANAISGAKEMFLQNGFSDFLSKPIDRGALAQSLLAWLPRDRIQQIEDK